LYITLCYGHILKKFLIFRKLSLISKPRIFIEPVVFWIFPDISDIKVDFPAPFYPRRVNI